MKRLMTSAMLAVLVASLPAGLLKAQSSDPCMVLEMYKATLVDQGTAAYTMAGEITPIFQILRPTRLEPGTYRFHVTTQQPNYYRIEGHDIWLHTMFCLKLALSDLAILTIPAPDSPGLAELRFTTRY